MVNYIVLRTNICNGGFRSHAEGKARYLITIDQPVHGERATGQWIAVIGLGSVARSEGQRHGIVNRSHIAIHFDGDLTRNGLRLGLFKASQEILSRGYLHFRTEDSGSSGVRSHSLLRSIQVMMDGVRIFIGCLVARVELNDSVFSVLNKILNALYATSCQYFAVQSSIRVPPVPGITRLRRQCLKNRIGLSAAGRNHFTRRVHRNRINLVFDSFVQPGHCTIRIHLIVLQRIRRRQIDVNSAVTLHIVENRAVPSFTLIQAGGNCVQCILVPAFGNADLKVNHFLLVEHEIDRTAYVLGITAADIMRLYRNLTLTNLIGFVAGIVFCRYLASIREGTRVQNTIIVELDCSAVNLVTHVVILICTRSITLPMAISQVGISQNLLPTSNEGSDIRINLDPYLLGLLIDFLIDRIRLVLVKHFDIVLHGIFDLFQLVVNDKRIFSIHRSNVNGCRRTTRDFIVCNLRRRQICSRYRLIQFRLMCRRVCQLFSGTLFTVFYRIPCIMGKHRIELLIFHKDQGVTPINRLTIRFCAPVFEGAQFGI